MASYGRSLSSRSREREEGEALDGVLGGGLLADRTGGGAVQPALDQALTMPPSQYSQFAAAASGGGAEQDAPQDPGAGTGQLAPAPIVPPSAGQAPAGGSTADRDKAINDWWLKQGNLTDPLEYVKRGYDQFLGRGIDPDTLRDLSDADGLGGQPALAYVQNLYDSPEGAAYRASGAGAGAGAAPSAFPGYSGPFNQGLYSGFNFDRARDTSKSAKDTFLEASGAYADDPRWRTKEGAAAWFRELIAPAMEAKGWKVLDVQGDKAFIQTRENPEGTWIDFVIGADGENPMLGWQDQSYGGDMGGGGGGMGGSGTDRMNVGGGNIALNAALSSPQGSFSFLDQLMQNMATNKLLDPAYNLQLGRG